MRSSALLDGDTGLNLAAVIVKYRKMAVVIEWNFGSQWTKTRSGRLSFTKISFQFLFSRWMIKSVLFYYYVFLCVLEQPKEKGKEGKEKERR